MKEYLLSHPALTIKGLVHQTTESELVKLALEEGFVDDGSEVAAAKEVKEQREDLEAVETERRERVLEKALVLLGRLT